MKNHGQWFVSLASLALIDKFLFFQFAVCRKESARWLIEFMLLLIWRGEGLKIMLTC